LKRPPLKESVLNNVYFDTCVYHQPGIDLLLDVIPVDNILFASEMVGAVRGIDPETLHYFDDTKRYIDGNKKLSAAGKQQIFEGNIRRVFKRFPATL
jgi:4-oxalmesaconate hydratase